ncbi:MAG: carboxypeptidase regulatory-like domain-containing protein [Chitinispirillaceae bacterium]|nr:carboxypeptidase regulatory-like domain-containing protein [Chitinispirillaceae bacterium]
MKMPNNVGLVLLCAVIGIFAQQSTDYLTVEVPIGAQPATRLLWVKWAGVSRGFQFPAPDSGTIYFDRSPGGGDLANYRYKVTTPYIDTTIATADSTKDNVYFPPSTEDPVAKRGIAFKAEDQTDMGFGVFYCVIALPTEDDTLLSNEFQIIIESPQPVDWIGPSGQVSSVTPTFQWKANTGVPYYHIILSDDVIKVDTTSGEVNLEGLSIIWQAITPATQMVYGAPDPSNTITADPPPLSPGQNYTWVVLNNYGNHPAFSSMKVKLPPGEFSIKGTQLIKPVCISPIDTTLIYDENNKEKVVFKWKNLDENANTYKLYIYVGSDFEGIGAQLVVYQTEVVADGREGEDEIDSVEIDAASVLTSNKYVWRVIAVNDQGAGTVGDTVGFNYESPVGQMLVYTKEQIIIGTGEDLDTVINPVGLVELQVEVLDGSLEAPLLFYTDNNGYLKRDRPQGTYRVTAKKSEFEELTKTIVVRKDELSTTTFYLERPDATVYGKVLDQSGKGINLASVYGISDRNDTVTAKSDALGNFILNCYAADWRIGVSMSGYQPTILQKITLESAENYNFGTIELEKNPYTLSGTIVNSAKAPLLGVRVRIYKDGALLSEVPSTPADGSFSFTIPSGTYMVTAEKTGFTTYSKSIDVLSSKSIQVSMEPGAALVTGYIYGKTWVGDREIVAPITNATVIFIEESTNDTVLVTSDETYGDFKASLAGNKTFSMYCAAEGFVKKTTPVVCTTVSKSTLNLYDTLQGLGSLPGTVIMSETRSAVKSANVSLIDTDKGTVISSAKSATDGTFELRSIPDGKYLFRAGKEGLVLDSVGGNDTITFSGGKAGRTSAKLYMKPGDKAIKWYVNSTDDELDVSIKIQSPLVKTISADDSLVKTGPGLYVLSVDADDDSILDLSYHRFTVADSEVTHIDTVAMLVYHTSADSIEPEHGLVTLSITSEVELDSAAIFYKDAVATTYLSQGIFVADTTFTTYTFEFSPPRDGSTMLYYFKAWRGNDIYGYDKETFSVYVKPDWSILTRYEIVPSDDSAFSFPINYKAPFSVKGYVSSAFLPDTTLDDDGISWSLTNAQGAVLAGSDGVATTVTTGSGKTSKPVVLKVTIDTTRIPLTSGLSLSQTVSFNVTGSAVASISVKRTDAGTPEPITTSGSDRAEFSAQGVDEAGTALDITPAWAVSPPGAGTISSLGIFKPKRNYAGIVRIIATVGKVTGEYRVDEESEPGLNVRFMMVNRSIPDTVSNQMGCTVVLPAGVVAPGDIGILEIANTALSNQFKRGFGSIRTVDTLAFDIQQLENVSMDLSDDSIRLNLSVPRSMRKAVANGKQKVAVAQWIEDSLLWKPLVNSRVIDDGNYVSAALSHFSVYALVYEPADHLSMEVSPNPFSPFIVPQYNPFNTDDRVPQHNGTCIKVHADISEARTEVNLKIFTILGDLVWSMAVQNADNIPYYIWWDGRTSKRQLQPAGNNHVVVVNGDRMCRNGRYFAVLTGRINGKEQRVMKHIVLMK